MKYCSGCNSKKPLSEFHNCKSKHDGKLSRCKKCRNNQNRIKSAEIGHDVLYARARDRNPELYKENARIYAMNNSSAAVARVKKYREENPNCRRAEYLNKREDKIKSAREWSLNNPEKRRAIGLKYYRNYSSKAENKPAIIARKLLSRVLNLSDKKKTSRTFNMLGYGKDELRSWIEPMFLSGMNWGNHGEWHIDHIKPISLFIKEGITDPSIINALSNLQPLWAKDNLSKGAKYDAI